MNPVSLVPRSMTELSGVMRFKRHFAVLVVACVALRGAPFAIRREL